MVLYVYRWRKFHPSLFGQRCQVLKRGKMNAALVQFENGDRHIVNSWSLRKVK